jgi:phosphoglycerate dehydrogenase-like enzyme
MSEGTIKRRVLFARAPGPIRDALWSPAAQQMARELGYAVEFYPERPVADAAEWPRRLRDVDALITTWGAPRLTREVLGDPPKLKIVGHAAGSVAAIVSPELYDRGVRVVSANPVMAHVVAEYSLMMTLIARTRITSYAQIAGRPLDWPAHEVAQQLGGATISIWGYGDISRRLIEMLGPLQPGRILIHSNSLNDAQAAKLGVEKVEFDELFARGDVIHLLAGLTPANKHRVSANQLAAIQDGAALINAGRADLVEPNALLEALRADRFIAVLDVHYEEPLPQDSPYRALPNVILTPHSAGFAGRENYVPFVLQEFARFFSNQALHGEITRERAGVMTDESLMKRA